MDELNIKQIKNEPDQEGLFTTNLPKSNTTIKIKPLTLRESLEIEDILDKYPQGRIPPIITLKLNKHIVELNGSRDKGDIAKFIDTMPITDSKYIRSFIYENEPRLDLIKEVIAPSGEKAIVNIAFGVEFFRPFFAI